MKHKLLLELLVTVAEECDGGGLAILRDSDGWRVLIAPPEEMGDLEKRIEAFSPEPTFVEAATMAVAVCESRKRW